MPVTYLELENFKSYGGKHIIGPFSERFTSVIGPNGSGKSNLMDAMSFVLGVQSKQLRSSQLKDLIFRGVSTKRLKASAVLVYEDEDGKDIRFGRSISPAGVGEYAVNGKTVTFADYEDALNQINVIVKARNFLVFQGDVESLARKTPHELVQLIETISGSMAYKQEYDEALAAKDTCESDMLFLFKKQKGFRSERRLLKDQKMEAERFDQLVLTKAQLQTDLYLWLLYHIDQDRQEQEALVEGLQGELNKLVEHESDAAAQLKQAKKDASAARRQTGQIEKKRIQLAGQMDQIESAILQTTEEVKNNKKKMAQDAKQLTKKKQEAASHEEKVAELDTEIAKFKQTQEELEADYQEVKRSAEVTLTAEQEQEYDRVRQAAAAASAEPRRVLDSHQRKLDGARATADSRTQELDEAKRTLTEVTKDVKDFTDRKEKLEKVKGGDVCW